MSETRKQRTPEQLIVEVQAKLEKLQIRQANQDAKSNPALKSLFEDLEAQRKIIREAKKGLGLGPQSFGARIAKHERWINKIQEEHMSAEIDAAAAELQKDIVEGKIQSAINASNSNSNSNSATA